MAASEPLPGFRNRASGSWLVGGMIALAVALAVFAVWYQRVQTRRCLAFYGSEAARRIQDAPRVELWSLAPSAANGSPRLARRTDITGARGLVHLRRGLVEDANFSWDRSPAGPAAPTFAFAFFDRAADPDPGTVLNVALDETGGSLSVDGRNGTISLGRIAAGLRKWLADVVTERPEPARGGAAGGG